MESTQRIYFWIAYDLMKSEKLLRSETNSQILKYLHFCDPTARFFHSSIEIKLPSASTLLLEQKGSTSHFQHGKIRRCQTNLQILRNLCFKTKKLPKSWRQSPAKFPGGANYSRAKALRVTFSQTHRRTQQMHSRKLMT